jgi:hypothetical protein
MHHRVQREKKKGREKLESRPQGDAEHNEAIKKGVPKGAQRKFSAQKSFLKECRAKYRRNIRRRSSKDVLKGMQNLYRQNRRPRSSKDVPKGMQNLHRKISGEAEK